MKPFVFASLALPLIVGACATAVPQDLADSGITDGGAGGLTSVGTGGMTTVDGGTSGSVAGQAGSTGNAFGGTSAFGGSGALGGAATTGGSGGATGGNASGGSGGSGKGGNGGSTSAAGSAGSGSAGKGGSGGSGGSSAGAAGTGTGGVVGTGTCTSPAFVLGASTKYAMGAKVVAMCNGGSPCTLANPAGQSGKSYEFSCLDMYNCGTQDPATTNWAQPPWQLTMACQ